MEQALILWVRRMESKRETVSGKMLIEKRQILKIASVAPRNSGGTTHGRSRLGSLLLHGEAASADLEKVESEISRLKVTASYDRKDILDVDESGLFAFASPDHGLATKQMSWKKSSKFCITVVFMANADGSQKWQVMFIGKYKNPRCFKGNAQKLQKYDAIVNSGIPIHEPYDIPEHLIPPDSRVEIDAKITAGYYTSGKGITEGDLVKTVGRTWEETEH